MGIIGESKIYSSKRNLLTCLQLCGTWWKDVKEIVCRITQGNLPQLSKYIIQTFCRPYCPPIFDAQSGSHQDWSIFWLSCGEVDSTSMSQFKADWLKGQFEAIPAYFYPRYLTRESWKCNLFFESFWFNLYGCLCEIYQDWHCKHDKQNKTNLFLIK